MFFCSGENEFSSEVGLNDGSTLRLYRSFADVPQSQWQSLSGPDDFFLQPLYLRTLDENPPENMTFWYGLVFDGEKPVVAMYFQVIHISNGQLEEILKPVSRSKKYLGFLAGWREWIKKGSDNLSLRLLVSGNNFVSGEHGIAVADGYPRETAFAHLSAAASYLMKNDREGGLISAVLVKDYIHDKKNSSGKLRRHGYHPFQVEPAMSVAIRDEWKSFEDYLAAMSKKYRNRARSVMRKSQQLQVKCFEADDAELLSQGLHRLYLNLHEKASFRMSSLSPGYFVAMKKAFPDQFSICAYCIGDKIVGFRSSFRLPGKTEAHFIGMDYSENEPNALYQRILFDYVEEGIIAGSKQVHLGRTASEIKSAAGAEPSDLTCYIRHRNSFTNHLIRHFIEYIEPGEWVQRHPFKETSDELAEVK